MTPSQFQILREDFAAMRLEFQASIRELVTRESFRDEQRRVDERFEGQVREISDLKKDLATEAQARVTSTQDALNAQIREKNEREKIRKATQWQWLLLAVSLVGGPVLGAWIGRLMGIGGP